MNNSVELSSNLDPEPLKSGIGTPLLTQSFELLSGSVGWGAGLQTSRLVQSKGSNPLTVLNKEYKVIYLMHKSAKFGLGFWLMAGAIWFEGYSQGVPWKRSGHQLII